MDPKKDLIYLLLFLAALFMLWMVTGGPARYETAKPLLEIPDYVEKTQKNIR
jgi:hypothetical protein